MKLRTQWVTALAILFAVTATGKWAAAQSRSANLYNNGPRLASQTAAVEELPSRVSTTSQAPPAGAPATGDMQYMSGGYPQAGYSDGKCMSGGCDDSCCDSGCYSNGCFDSGYCGNCCVGNLLGMGNSRFFVTADYLNVHASFSQATAFVREDLDSGSDQFIPLEFGYNSSYRVGGGWKSCCCGDQIRFMFTQMTSDASSIAYPGDIVPNEASPPPGGQTNINANVDARTFDLECAKTIPLGGQCCDCGDGCCDSCCTGCPAWDITWSGGIRWADVGWQQSFIAYDSTDFPVTDCASRYELSRRWSANGPGRPPLLL